MSRRRVDAFEPVVEQRLQARVVQLEQVGQARQRAVRVGDRALRRRVERQLGRRRVADEGAHDVEAADRQRVEALAQRRLQRRLPAALDVHLGPQAGQAVEAVLGQPRLELALGLHLLLQRAQRLQAGGEVGLARLVAIEHLLLRAALLVELGHLLADLVPGAPRSRPWPRRPRRCAASGRRASAGRAWPAVWRSAARRSRRLRSARACSSMLRLSAASTWICCCTCVTSPRWPLVRVCAMRTASSKSGRRMAFLLGLRREQLGLFGGAGDLPRRCAPARAWPAPGGRATARSAPAARPGAARRAGGLRPRSGCVPRAGSPPAAPAPARPATRAGGRTTRSARRAPLPAAPRRGAGRPCATRARWSTPARPA